MKQQIFLVEDDADITRLMRHHLEAAGYLVRSYAAIGAVLPDALKHRPALFLLDIMVPGGSGLALCEQIRASEILAPTPIIFLTAKTSEADRVLGFEVGADDYISKPFSPRELVARIKAVLRRFEPPLPSAVRELGDLRIDTGAMTLTVRGGTVSTTATEFRLLDYFARHAGREIIEQRSEEHTSELQSQR